MATYSRMTKIPELEAPWDIQTGIIEPESGTGIDADFFQAIKLNYMGRAEFEFGAHSESLARLYYSNDAVKLFSSSILSDVSGRPLLLLGNFDRHFSHMSDMEAASISLEQRISQYMEGVKDIATGKIRTGSFSNFSAQTEPFEPIVPRSVRNRLNKADLEAYVIEQRALPRTNFWWDIANDVMMSFEPDFMDRLPGYLERIFDKMISQNKIEAREQIPTMS